MIVYRFLYSVFILIYPALIRFAGLWNAKARLWVDGRQELLAQLKSDLRNEKSPIIWMHCASLGEYEQGKPLVEKLRALYPGHKLLLTFFSPSGYTVIKPKAVADYIYYLPFGGRTLASRFVDTVKPVLVLWIKYEYWYYYLIELKRRSIPLLLISGNFYKKQPFFKWYGTMHREMLKCFTHLFVQTAHSKELLQGLVPTTAISVSGDTRFDRVIEIAEQFQPIEAVQIFCNNHKVIVAGSTWPEDEEELDHYANTHPDIRFIIAPHEIHEAHIKDIEKLFKTTIRFSALSSMSLTAARPIAADIPNDERMMDAESELKNNIDEVMSRDQQEPENIIPNVLIIDNIGMLSRLYRYATITYVGGGFGEEGVHNVLEAAVYGKPVIFGPVFNKFIEAIELLEEAGGYTIETALELENILHQLLSDEKLYAEVCDAAKKYVYSKKGATEKIIRFVQENRLLIN